MYREIEGVENLAKLDNDARVIMESNMDTVLEDPKKGEEIYRYSLTKMGIEPNLETLLSYLVGEMVGLVGGFYLTKHHRNMNREEMTELIQLLKRRASELRDAFISTRIKP